MELNREQIIKALECWASGSPCHEKCSILEHEEGANCLRLTTRSSLALIKEITEDNEKIGLENFDLVCELSRIKEDTVRKMEQILQNRITGKLAYHGWYLKETVFPKIAKEILEGL